MAATVTLVLLAAAPASAHPPDEVDLQHDGDTPGDASDVCREPFPALSRDEATTGRLLPVPPLLPVSDTQDNYALELQAGDLVSISTASAAHTLLPADPLLAPSAQDGEFPMRTVFHLRVWEPGCGDVVAEGEPTQGLGEQATVTAVADGTYTVEVSHPPVALDPTGSLASGGEPSPGASPAEPLADKRCHPHCEAFQTANLLAGYDLAVS